MLCVSVKTTKPPHRWLCPFCHLPPLSFSDPPISAAFSSLSSITKVCEYFIYRNQAKVLWNMGWLCLFSQICYFANNALWPSHYEQVMSKRSTGHAHQWSIVFDSVELRVKGVSLWMETESHPMVYNRRMSPSTPVYSTSLLLTIHTTKSASCSAQQDTLQSGNLIVFNTSNHIKKAAKLVPTENPISKKGWRGHPQSLLTFWSQMWCITYLLKWKEWKKASPTLIKGDVIRPPTTWQVW